MDVRFVKRFSTSRTLSKSDLVSVISVENKEAAKKKGGAEKGTLRLDSIHSAQKQWKHFVITTLFSRSEEEKR